RVLADGEAPLRVPRERERAVALVREVDEGRQELARLDLVARDELRDAKHLDLGLVALERGRGERAVRRAEIDTNRRTGHQSSTSAGATTCASCWPTRVGSLSSSTRQPR